MRGSALAEGMAVSPLAAGNICCAANIPLSANLQTTRRACSALGGFAQQVFVRTRGSGCERYMPVARVRLYE